MATDFFSLPPAQQIQISTDLSLKYYGVTKPLTEAGQNAKLNNAIEKNKQSLNELKSNLNSIVSASAQARGLPESEIRNLLYNLNVNDPRLKSSRTLILVTVKSVANNSAIPPGTSESLL